MSSLRLLILPAPGRTPANHTILMKTDTILLGDPTNVSCAVFELFVNNATEFLPQSSLLPIGS